MTKINSLKLACRMSLTPNALGYCGRKTAPAKFKKCIIDGKCNWVEKELKKFIVLYPYLRTLSKIFKLPVFSYPVIESYWLGNELLKKAKPEDYYILIDQLSQQGVPQFLIKELEQKQPNKFIPCHLFQVLHVGVGRASSSVQFNLRSINNCMIRWGEVKKINQKKVIVDVNYLIKISDKYIFKKKLEEITYDDKIVSDLKKGDNVAVHWQQIIKILTEREKNNLEYWSNEVLKYI